MPVFNPITGGGVGLDTAAGDARYDRLPVASVAALKALTPVDGEVRQTLGYYAANDGGGGPAWTFTLGDTSTAVDGGTVVADDGGTGRWKRSLAGAGFRAAFFGAKADGTTDDRAALVAQFAAPTAGDVAHLAPGTYGIASTLTPTARQNVNVRGAGMWTTTIKALPSFASANLFSLLPNTGRVVFEDLCFDGSELHTGNMLFVNGRYLKNVVFRRCRFTGMANTKYGLTFQELNGAVVEDCVFHTDGTGLGYGLSASTGVRNLALRRNHFRHLQQGAYVSSSGGTADWDTNLIEDVEVVGNHFDGAWWLLRHRVSGNATYAATSLTDGSGDFAWLDGFGLSTYPNVRLLEPVGTENRAMTITGNSLTDAGQTFVTSGVLRGHLVRATNGTTSLVAFVSGVQSETVLRVEGWLGASDLLPAAAPGTTDAIGNWTYSCYKIHLARVTGRAGTTVNVDRWHDLKGRTTVPSNAWRYEILHRRPIYQGFFNDRGRKFRISGNHFQRCWADQCALQGTIDSAVSGNVIESGQDMGITLDANSRRCTVENNVVRHQGVGAIWVAGSHHAVSGNQVQDCTWQIVSGTNEPGMVIVEGTDSTINNNVVLRLDAQMEQAKYGISLRAGAERNRLAWNTSTGHALAGIRLKDATVARNVLRFNTGTVSDASNNANDVDNGGGTLAGREYFPMRSGAYYGAATSSPASSIGTGTALTANRWYANALRVFEQTTFDQIAVNVTTAAAASIRLYVYSAHPTTGLPDALRLAADPIDASTTGEKTSPVSLVLQPGVYWLGAVSDGTPSTNFVNHGQSFLGITAPSSTNRNGGLYRTTTYGVPPASFGPVSGYLSAEPAVYLRVV